MKSEFRLTKKVFSQRRFFGFFEWESSKQREIEREIWEKWEDFLIRIFLLSRLFCLRFSRVCKHEHKTFGTYVLWPFILSDEISDRTCTNAQFVWYLRYRRARWRCKVHRRMRKNPNNKQNLIAAHVVNRKNIQIPHPHVEVGSCCFWVIFTPHFSCNLDVFLFDSEREEKCVLLTSTRLQLRLVRGQYGCASACSCTIIHIWSLCEMRCSFYHVIALNLLMLSAVMSRRHAWAALITPIHRSTSLSKSWKIYFFAFSSKVFHNCFFLLILV